MKRDYFTLSLDLGSELIIDNFAAGGGQQHEAMQRLVAAGLATAGRAANEMTYFHATRLGCKAAGLDGAGIKRAMED